MIRMDQMDFNHHMQRIFQTFGDKTYSKPRMDMIYARARRIPPENFAKIVDQFVLTHRNAPMPIDFQSAVYGEMKALGLFDNEQEFQVNCVECEDLGLIYVFYQAEHSLMKCTCYEGKQDHTNLPMWHSSLRGAYGKAPVPRSWFPKVSLEEVTGSQQDMWKATRTWLEKIRKAENYWKEKAMKSQPRMEG